MGVLIQLCGIEKRYGDRAILVDVNVAFNEGDRVGVIGRNGAGKTTLCRIITGEEEPDSGEVRRAAGLQLGYLQQEDPFGQDEHVMGFLRRYSGKEKWECGKLAGRFQLGPDHLQARIGQLSGGFQTRVKLAGMLLRSPNFLVLDEPSNYLDLKTLILLENVLRSFPGGVMIVSHDREFLKRTCSETVEIENGKVTLYPGAIEEYLGYKARRLEQARQRNMNIELEKKRVKRFIDRFRAKATKARQVQSRIKYLDRLEQQRIEVVEPARNVRIKLPPVTERKGAALRCDDLEIGYPGKSVAAGINVEIERGRHVAVVGDNGEGKTTFLMTLAGQIPPRAGRFSWGHGDNPGIYAQQVYSALDSEHDVITCLKMAAAPDVTAQEILDLAGSFLFSGDDVNKPVRILSGGERARVCLAALLLSKKQVLLLDEPNNHLDFESTEALAYALREYKGTILFTSHDRTFVQLLATGILEVKSGRIANYPGSYETYVHLLQNECREEPPEHSQGSQERSAVRAKSGGSTRYDLLKQRRSRLRKLKAEARKIDERLAAYEREKAAILDQFARNPTRWSKETAARLSELERLIERDENLWLDVNEEIERLESAEL